LQLIQFIPVHSDDDDDDDDDDDGDDDNDECSALRQVRDDIAISDVPS